MDGGCSATAELIELIASAEWLGRRQLLARPSDIRRVRKHTVPIPCRVPLACGCVCVRRGRAKTTCCSASLLAAPARHVALLSCHVLFGGEVETVIPGALAEGRESFQAGLGIGAVSAA